MVRSIRQSKFVWRKSSNLALDRCGVFSVTYRKRFISKWVQHEQLKMNHLEPVPNLWFETKWRRFLKVLVCTYHTYVWPRFGVQMFPQKAYQKNMLPKLCMYNDDGVVRWFWLNQIPFLIHYCCCCCCRRRRRGSLIFWFRMIGNMWTRNYLLLQSTWSVPSPCMISEQYKHTSRKQHHHFLITLNFS